MASLTLTEGELAALAGGFVPDAVKARIADLAYVPIPPDRAIKRVMASVTESAAGCWESSLTPSQRYPYVGIGGGNPQLAHRVMYAATAGRFLASLSVRHRCDNPRCVAPHHLELGTHADNMRDKTRRR